MKRFLLLSILAIAAVPARAQVSVDEAQKRLEDRQAAKLAEREKIVGIKQGELDDLRAEIASLRKEVVSLRQQLVVAKPPLLPAPPPAKPSEPNDFHPAVGMFGDTPGDPKIVLRTGLTYDQVVAALTRPRETRSDESGHKICHFIIWRNDALEHPSPVVQPDPLTKMRDVLATFDEKGLLIRVTDDHAPRYDEWSPAR